MTGTERSLVNCGPWGDDDCTTMLFPVCNERGAAVVSETDALVAYCGMVDDWREYALSVEGPLMYHAATYDEDADAERIEPCECEDEHDGQVEVWRVVSQAQEPTARARERKRIVRRLADVWPDDELWPQASVFHEIERAAR